MARPGHLQCPGVLGDPSEKRACESWFRHPNRIPVPALLATGTWGQSPAMQEGLRVPFLFGETPPSEAMPAGRGAHLVHRSPQGRLVESPGALLHPEPLKDSRPSPATVQATPTDALRLIQPSRCPRRSTCASRLRRLALLLLPRATTSARIRRIHRKKAPSELALAVARARRPEPDWFRHAP